MKYKLTQKSVNSKALFNEIHEFIDEAIQTLGIRWSSDIYRSSFVDLVEDWLMEKLMEGKITQYDVIGDSRNNPPNKVANGIITVEVQYKQQHCLNTTRLIYEITDDGEAAIDDLFSFFAVP